LHCFALHCFTLLCIALLCIALISVAFHCFALLCFLRKGPAKAVGAHSHNQYVHEHCHSILATDLQTVCFPGSSKLLLSFTAESSILRGLCSTALAAKEVRAHSAGFAALKMQSFWRSARSKLCSSSSSKLCSTADSFVVSPETPRPSEWGSHVALQKFP
jgi:hypothetical protein